MNVVHNPDQPWRPSLTIVRFHFFPLSFLCLSCSLMAILYESEGMKYYTGASDTVTGVLLSVII